MKDTLRSNYQAYIPDSVTIVSDEQARIACQERDMALSGAHEQITYAALSGDAEALKTAKLDLEAAHRMPTPFTNSSFMLFKQAMLVNDPIYAFIADIVDSAELEFFVSHHPECLTEEDSFTYQQGTQLSTIADHRKADISTIN